MAKEFPKEYPKEFSQKFPIKLSTCDIHREEKRFFLNRDHNFNYNEQKEIDKDECFTSFRLFDQDNDDNEIKKFDNNNYNYSQGNIIDFNNSGNNGRNYKSCNFQPNFIDTLNYDLKILQDIVREENPKTTYIHNWKKEEPNIFIIKKIDKDDSDQNYQTDRKVNWDENYEEKEEEENNSPFAHIFHNVNIEEISEENKYKEEIFEKMSKQKNEDLVDIIILKNILNLYFLFDVKNEGYIDLKYAAFVIKNIYENNTCFLLKHIKLNDEQRDKYENEYKYGKEKGNEQNNEKRFEKGYEKGYIEQKNGMITTKKSCSKKINVKEDIIKNFSFQKFGKVLLIILKDVSLLHKQHGVLEKDDFVNLMFQYIKKNDWSDNIYKTFLYPHNIVTSFYDYLNYLKIQEDEQKERKKQLLKKEKTLENIIHIDKNLINSDLRYHIKHFQKKKAKKLKILKEEKDAYEMKECTFCPTMTATPHYLLKNKFDKQKKYIENICQTEKKIIEKKRDIMYDIDNSIERTLMLPNNTKVKTVNDISKNDIINRIFQTNKKPVHLKYIIHQGFQKPKKLTWVDTLRNKTVKSITELLENDETNDEENKAEKKNFVMKNKYKNQKKKEKNILSKFTDTPMKRILYKQTPTFQDTQDVMTDIDYEISARRYTNKHIKKERTFSFSENDTTKDAFHKKINVNNMSFIDPLTLNLTNKGN